jgi:hypothetical protein
MPVNRSLVRVESPYQFVTTLTAKTHIRMQAGDRMMCGRQFDPSTYIVSPAKSVAHNELCESCIRSWLYQASGSSKVHEWKQDELAYQRATLLSEMRIAADILARAHAVTRVDAEQIALASAAIRRIRLRTEKEMGVEDGDL